MAASILASTEMDYLPGSTFIENVQRERPSTSSGSLDAEGLARLSRNRRDSFLDSDGLHDALEELQTGDDAVVSVLCGMLTSYMNEGKTTVRARRGRRVAQSDAFSHAMRSLRSRLFTPSYLSSPTVDALVDLLLLIATTDGKTQLKMRMGGLLGSLAEMVSEGRPMTPRLLRLIARSIRSPRNAQFVSRLGDFPKAVLARATESRANGESMARHLEILYLACKNKRTRLSLLSGGATRSLVSLLDRLSSQLRDPSPSTLEASLLLVALLKLFTNSRQFVIPIYHPGPLLLPIAVSSLILPPSLTKPRILGQHPTDISISTTLNGSSDCGKSGRSREKRVLAGKGKEEVIGAGLIPACQRCLNALSNNNDSAALQLQDSLCALCIRCVPAERFPLAGKVFPLHFDLPARRAKTAARRSTTSYNRASDDARSSDDDEGEEALIEELGEDSGVSGGEEEEDEGVEEGDGEGRQPEGRECIRQQTDKPNLANYARFFSERNGVLKREKRERPPVPYTQSILMKVKKSKSVMEWTKIAFPDMVGPDRELPLQPLLFSTNAMREVAATATRRLAKGAAGKAGRMNRVVYSLDLLLGPNPPPLSRVNNGIGNDDRSRLGRVDLQYDHLLFESRFESGNLRTAIQVDTHHYELILQPDINQSRDHFQWFYFEISNGEANVEYTFEIVNCLKSSSMFAHGMQPVAFSVGEAAAGRPGWVRFGHSLCYYRNHYVIDAEGGGRSKDRFFSLRFNFALRHRGDILYIAYHFPYTFSFLQASLECWLSRTLPWVSARSEVIGHSLAGNPLSLVTVTSPGSRADLAARDVILLTARVHPGESNASWIMHGVLEYLLTSEDPEAREARQRLVFKLVPMLNPDGVLAGNHRCSLTGHDLNRVWDSPSRSLHPEIYHSKAIIQNIVSSALSPGDPSLRAPLLFLDLHGHSRRSSCFLYGNNSEQSWLSSDAFSPSLDFIQLPGILETRAPAFSIQNCRWTVERSKEGSARVALWRQLGLSRSYTMECTYAGFVEGQYKGYQIGICELKEIGRNLVQAALELSKLATELEVEGERGMREKGEAASTPNTRSSILTRRV